MRFATWDTYQPESNFQFKIGASEAQVFIASVDESKNWGLYPNPASSNLRINVNGQNLGLSIFDNQGRLVETRRIMSGTTHMNIADLPVGLYHF